MKLGLQLNGFDWEGGPAHFGATLAEIARAAEEEGFDRIAVADHLWQQPIMGGPGANEPECYTTLAYLAARTKRAKLTAMVSGVHFRHPAVLAKTVTTLDVLSGGRAWLGVGTGHYEEEARGLGIPFPPQKQRYEMLEETIQICLKMWAGERGDEGAVRGPTIPPRARAQPPAEPEQTPPSHHDRWRRREDDAPPRRPLRRRLQPA